MADQSAADEVAGVVTKLSPFSVADTVSRIEAVVSAKGITVFDVIDHSGGARSVGLEMRDTKLVIFGNPKAGTAVMVAAPLAALDQPLKLLVWADGEQTKVSYTSASELAARYHLSDELAGPLAATDPISDAVIGKGSE